MWSSIPTHSLSSLSSLPVPSSTTPTQQSGMTRTERSVFPRALVRDRSESKSGFDKSLRKNGSGHHNWGSLADEGYLEAAAMEDGEQDLADATEKNKQVMHEKPVVENKHSPFTEEERQIARDFRRTALRNHNIDLSAIARTSAAVSMTPPGRSIVHSDTLSLVSA